MTVHQLMLQLAERDIHVSAHGGELTIRASKGALTDDLKRDLVRLKSEILSLLRATDASVTGDPSDMPSTLVLRPQDRLEPFPFADLQVAFYMADDPYMQYHVRPHYYCETDRDELDVPRFESAVNKALMRHRGEMVMVTQDEQLCILPELPTFQCQVIDLRSLDSAATQEALASTRARMSRAQLSLTRWPWFDLLVSRWLDEGQEHFRIHWNHNNFYTDGYGVTVLQRDIDRYYEDPDVALPKLDLTFRDAVLGLEALSRSPEGERAKAYWTDRLADLPGPPDLPMTSLNRRCRSRLQRRQGFLSPQAWRGFKSHAAQYGLTPTGAIVCAYAEVLSAWSGSQHFILSNMVTRRLPLHPQIMEMVGNFASLYPLEVDLQGGLPFSAKAVRLQQQMMRDSGNREWGGMQVMQALNRLKGEMGAVPCPFVVGSGLFMEKYRKADFACLETAQTVFDHQFWELDDGRYFYVWDLLEEFFPPGLIDAMWLAFGQLLERLALHAEAWTETRFDFGAAAELQFADPQSDGGNDSGLLHDALCISAQNRAMHPAVCSSNRKVSYAELDGWADGVAAALMRHGLKQGERVAVVMDRGPGIAAATHGILRAGATYVPVDPGLPAERLRYMLDNSQARLVLTDKVRLVAIDWPPGTIVIDILNLANTSEVMGHAQTCPPGQAKPNDLAYVIYTSGSTGRPKGVMVDHRGALNTIRDVNRRFGVTGDDVIFGVSSFSFDLSVYDLFGTMDVGATLVYPDAEAALNPSHWLDLLLAHRVTVWNSAPPLMGLLVETALRREVQLPDLRLVMLSGDWIPVELPAAIRQMAPSATIISLGGATEASIWSIFYEIGDVASNWTRIPYGKPLANQAWHIRDANNRPTPVWTVGDLYISGMGLAKGYWGDEDKTRASFIQDPLTSKTLYKTGDRGRYLPDGNIDFLGRADTQVKIQGHRIELGEIESLLQAHPAVKEAVVLAQPLNGTARELAAYVSLKPEARLQHSSGDEAIIQALRADLQRQVPSYMVPAGWAMLAAMPLSPNGKTDRKALGLARYAKAGTTRPQAQKVAPRSPLEHTLVGIWKVVLKQTDGGVHDDFFDSGGQSIDAVRFVARVQEQTGKMLSLGDMWERRTIAQLAEFIAQLDGAVARGNLVRLGPDRAGRPFFMVHPAGGHCVGYFELAGMLSRPCWGLAVQADDVASNRLGSIEAIAKRYVEQLRQTQQQGPYSLVGWSSGGCIAFEMAAQLEQSGEQVDRVVLIDCPAPRVHTPANELTKLRWFFEDLNQGLPTEALKDELLEALPADQRFSQAVMLMNQHAQSALEEGPLAQLFIVFGAIVDAVLNYRPRAIRADLLVLRATQGAVSEFACHPHAQEPDWGWRGLSSGRLNCDRVVGSHHTVLRKPGVDAIAAWLASASTQQATLHSEHEGAEGVTSA